MTIPKSCICSVLNIGNPNDVLLEGKCTITMGMEPFP